MSFAGIASDTAKLIKVFQTTIIETYYVYLRSVVSMDLWGLVGLGLVSFNSFN